jgi:hypothetical protein
MLLEGWSCVGGVVIAFDREGRAIRMYQTMIKSLILKN